MATFDQIKEIRLQINDPADVINIINGAVAGAPQTAYLVSGIYRDSDDNALEIEVSDERIGSWYDTYGTTGAVVRAIRQILYRIGAKIQLVRTQEGTDSIQYTALSDKRIYYKQLLDDAENQDDKTNDNTTGRWAQTSSVEIAGGDI